MHRSRRIAALSPKRSSVRAILYWLFACTQNGGQRAAGGLSGGPRPLKMKAADSPVNVEDLANEEQPRPHARLHRRRIDLGERDAAGGDLCVVVAARIDDGERPFDDRAHEAAAY